MEKINIDYRDYILSMEEKDVVFIDPPWSYDDKSPKATGQLSYELWTDNNKELDFIFKNIKTRYLFMWVTNSFLYDVFRTNHYNYQYKTIITWIKYTKTMKLFYGLGHSFRNSTEQLLLFNKNKFPPIKTTYRNLIQSQHKKRTAKPHSFEVKILDHVIKENSMNQFAYIFSGLDVDIFNNYNIQLIDIAI